MASALNNIGTYPYYKYIIDILQTSRSVISGNFGTTTYLSIAQRANSAKVAYSEVHATRRQCDGPVQCCS